MKPLVKREYSCANSNCVVIKLVFRDTVCFFNKLLVIKHSQLIVPHLSFHPGAYCHKFTFC